MQQMVVVITLETAVAGVATFADADRRMPRAPAFMQ
jgi:hypothetical protein